MNKLKQNSFFFLSLIAMIAISGVLSYGKVSEYLILIIFAVSLLLLNVVRHYITKQNLQLVVDLTKKSSSRISIFSVLPYVLFLSIFLIPQKYFLITVVIISLLIILPLFRLNKLVFTTQGVRHVFRWTLQWKDIKFCELDKEKKSLIIQDKDGKNRVINGIDEKYYMDIISNIDNNLRVG